MPFRSGHSARRPRRTLHQIAADVVVHVAEVPRLALVRGDVGARITGTLGRRSRRRRRRLRWRAHWRVARLAVAAGTIRILLTHATGRDRRRAHPQVAGDVTALAGRAGCRVAADAVGAEHRGAIGIVDAGLPVRRRRGGLRRRHRRRGGWGRGGKQRALAFARTQPTRLTDGALIDVAAEAVRTVAGDALLISRTGIAVVQAQRTHAFEAGDVAGLARGAAAVGTAHAIGAVHRLTLHVGGALRPVGRWWHAAPSVAVLVERTLVAQAAETIHTESRVALVGGVAWIAGGAEVMAHALVAGDVAALVGRARH